MSGSAYTTGKSCLRFNKKTKDQIRRQQDCGKSKTVATSNFIVTYSSFVTVQLFRPLIVMLVNLYFTSSISPSILSILKGSRGSIKPSTPFTTFLKTLNPPSVTQFTLSRLHTFLPEIHE